MLKTPGEKPRILVTNDDGINAPGLKVMEAIAREISDEVWVVAPEINHSGAGHSLTLRRPLRTRRLSERHYAVDGTPTDCVLLALQNILEDKAINLVLSGVNHGHNLGEDVTYSGTIAACMEATLLQVPAIAFSQACHERHPVKWKTAEQWAPGVIRPMLSMEWPTDVLVNLNFPDVVAGSVKGVKVTRQGKSKIGDELIERIDPRGEPYVWIGLSRDEAEHADDTDVFAVRAGWVSVTPIQLDMTHRESFAKLTKLLQSQQE
ncbi:MAG: 5'/3'-nucleotidase SurE [Geminicoccaceae bacterium]